jgi:hypothetical protein
MFFETSNCVSPELTKNSGATSLGDLTRTPKNYNWNVASGCGSASTFPEYSITLTTPYTVSGVYILKTLTSGVLSKDIQVYVDNVLCGTLTDRNTVANWGPI